MSIQLRLTSNGITPDIARRLRLVSNPKPILEAAGQAAVSLTKRAFREPTFRPSAWAARQVSNGALSGSELLPTRSKVLEWGENKNVKGLHVRRRRKDRRTNGSQPATSRI